MRKAGREGEREEGQESRGVGERERSARDWFPVE